MESIILVVHIIAAVTVIGLVLIQQGKGADAGASFGGGASQTVFGSAGSGNFLTRSTAILATVFFVTSFTLAFYAKRHAQGLADVGLPAIQQEEQKALDQSVPVVSESAPAAGDAPVVEESKQ